MENTSILYSVIFWAVLLGGLAFTLLLILSMLIRFIKHCWKD